MQRSITFRLSLISVIVVILFSALLIGYNSYRNSNIIKEEIKLTLDTIVASVNTSLSSSIKKGELSEVYRIVGTICDNRNIARCVILYENKSLVDISTQFFKNFLVYDYSIKKSDIEIAILRFYVPNKNFFELASRNIIQIILLIILFIGVMLFVFKLILKDTFNEFQVISNLLLNTNLLDKNDEILSYKCQTKEFNPIVDSFKKYIIKINESKKLLLEKDRLKQKELLNRQIAHDIRSPLEALKSVVSNLGKLDFSTKQIITNSIARISNIASGLLNSRQEQTECITTINLRLLMDDIINDKNFEKNLILTFNSNISYKDSFILGNENNLYRSISNLINNAFEAQKAAQGIIIFIDKIQSNIFLSIKDTGAGMSKEMLDKVIIGGVTTKEKGNGLGLSFAKKIIESYTGKFEIKSKLGWGTEICITLPTIPAPKWFLDEIIIGSTITDITCVDDDPSFLELYKEKFKSFNVRKFNERQLDQIPINKHVLYFFDFDLGRGGSGLDFIIKKNISNHSVLVTSMYEDTKIQNLCIKNGIKIIPKQIFNNTNIIIQNKIEYKAAPTIIVLIDDDELMHMSWQLEANKKNIKLDSFKTIDEFIEKSHLYPKETNIYIDSNLADNVSGEIESERIYHAGFTELYLATGYSPGNIKKPNWIKAILGKRPDF